METVEITLTGSWQSIATAAGWVYVSADTLGFFFAFDDDAEVRGHPLPVNKTFAVDLQAGTLYARGTGTLTVSRVPAV